MIVYPIFGKKFQRDGADTEAYRKRSIKTHGRKLYRGYYTVARRYEFYFRVAKQYFTNERSE